MMNDERLFSVCASLWFLAAAVAFAATNQVPYGGYEKGTYIDPIPHGLITEPYRVCQDLEELTTRIDNLYRKPFHKMLAKTGVMQPETVYFKDAATGHEVASITRELCADMSHGDLGRPVWTCDGSRLLFMGNRGYLDADGKFQKTAWPGRKYIMNADYTGQRVLMVWFKDKYTDSEGRDWTRAASIYSKFNILDPVNPRVAYYAVGNTLWRVTLSDDLSDNVAERIATFSNARIKIIQDISADRRLLAQDSNADRDRATGKPAYMPEIHLVDLTKAAGEPGAYYHHPFDYGLAEVRDDKGKLVHDAANNYQFHSMAFGKKAGTISWSYGPMTEVGEPLGWSLDVSKGLDGTPTCGEVKSGAGANPWGQYESHGHLICDTSTLGLYFSGTIDRKGEKPLGGWGIWVRDYAATNTPRFIMTGPGGHIAGGNNRNPRVWAAHMSAGWREKVKESDGIVWGDPVDATGELLCYTFSDVRGGMRRDSKTREWVKWSGMNNNDFRPYHSIPRPLLSPDGTKVWFHSAMLMPFDEYVGIYVAVTRRPQPPRNLRIGAASEHPTLCWQRAEESRETRRYHVYRGDAPDAEMKEIAVVAANPVPSGEAGYTYTDATPAGNAPRVYAVTAEEWSTLESDETSNILTVTPGSGLPWAGKPGPSRRGWDKTPPPAVEAFQATPESDEPGQYRLKWKSNPAPDLRYYNVYCSPMEQPAIVQKRRLVSPPADSTEYLDWSAPTGVARVYYAITAVDRQGNESAPAFAEAGK